MTDLDIVVEYNGGMISVRFEGDRPDGFDSDTETGLADRAVDELLEIDDIWEWQTNFETAGDYTMPGHDPDPVVGTVVDTGDGFDVNITIDSAADAEWGV